MIAALVIAPLAWLLLAFGQDSSLTAFAKRADGGALVAHDFLRPLLLLAAAGLVLGLIATLRFSPLGASLTGVLYLASYALLLVSPGRIVDAFPKNVTIAGLHADAVTPVRTGTAALVGAMMLIAMVSIGRWRRWPDKEDSFWSRSWDDDKPLGSSTTSTTTLTRTDPWNEPLGAPLPEPARTPTNLSNWASTPRP